ncbi:uncharacterized protein SCHCODRAFT_02606177 [Schizophyllum commune H4-8]|uniref:uncharacterized protein n=1 Tax=Schizophyllum commune (strain H4-8 / FGSC 9210) TaxID=578458 RepID=UPI0021607AB9|nr:uncharacterized protein SCHCODRAFT_02606161 [Schizophyllum commune H4-8]XP_050202865.1 uncharacterized protein SCHCODRAFT_02606177 [Schizophyllum commune H4-8]KAI5899800.1 hypothetical protein SCHCODRAFT_02606161 [Schizophyllum commune H4-8]KAI5899808.1 hypothetical protein SCHCODRAFT_02606177 [Schizophyllum commune H4-8]
MIHPASTPSLSCLLPPLPHLRSSLPPSSLLPFSLCSAQLPLPFTLLPHCFTCPLLDFPFTLLPLPSLLSLAPSLPFIASPFLFALLLHSLAPRSLLLAQLPSPIVIYVVIALPHRYLRRNCPPLSPHLAPSRLLAL